MLHPNDPHIVALATDAKVETKLPVLDLNDDGSVADFIVRFLKIA
jgi:molybdopterin-guanine dinucleotide biosynthesis protein B